MRVESLSAVVFIGFLLIYGPSAALAAGDCADLAASALAEPSWYAEHCASPWNAFQEPAAASRGPLNLAYAHDVGFVSDNFVSHALNDFPGQTVLGANAMSLYAYDFDETAATLYALDNDTQMLGTVSLAGGAFTAIGSAVPLAGHTWSGLTIGKDGKSYASSTDGFESSLYSVDPATGAATLIGTDTSVDLIIDISIDCDGAIYGHDVASDSIYTIDPATGLATLVGATGVDSSFAQGMDFDNDTGILYAWTYQGGGANIFGTIDLATGALTALATDNPTGEFEGAIQTTCRVAPAGAQFQVNTYTSDDQSTGQVSLDADGDFVVVWGNAAPFGTVSSVQGQRYAADGTPAGGEFQVNTYDTGRQRNPSVALGADGEFVVVWESDGSSGTDSFWSIQGQRYASDGTPAGGEFQVNTYTQNTQASPSVALGAAGDFVVVWTSFGSSGTDSASWSVQGQRYAADGSLAGGEFQVNTYTFSGQYSAQVSADANGDFVVVWQSYGSSGTDSSRWSVQGQRYAPDGTPAGGEFQVNTYTTADQTAPSVSMDAGGDFVVTWTSRRSGGTDTWDRSVHGQRYVSDGTTVGDQFQVNTYTTGQQGGPRVSLDDGGDFVVAWASRGSGGTDSSEYSVQAQRYGDPCAGSACIFAGGFESGDTSGWSFSAP